MSNSPLVSFIKYSPNNSGKRTKRIDRITPHCVVGQMTIESMGHWFAQKAAQSSSNYGIGTEGRIGLFVNEDSRSWCSSSSSNDQRAVTIECASDKTTPYAMNDRVYQSLIDLCEDICRRNGKTKLIWFGDKAKTLNYTPAADEMLITVHRWFKNKECPGNWLYARLGNLAETVTKRLQGQEEDEDMTQEKFNEMMNNWIISQAEREDVGSWSNEARNWAEINGYIQGDEKGRKMYRKPITREEMIVLLYRILKQMGMNK